MKKIKFILAFGLLLVLSKKGFCAWSDDTLVNRSFFTINNDTLVSISTTDSPTTKIIPPGILVGLIISTSNPGGSVTFYDSQGVKTSTIAIVSMAGTGNGAFYIPFEVRLSSGLTYTVANNVPSGITIIYKYTRPTLLP